MTFKLLKQHELIDNFAIRVNKFIEEKYNEGYSVDLNYPSENIAIVNYFVEI